MFTTLIVTFAIAFFATKKWVLSLSLTAAVFLASTFGLFAVIFGS